MKALTREVRDILEGKTRLTYAHRIDTLIRAEEVLRSPWVLMDLREPAPAWGLSYRAYRVSLYQRRDGEPNTFRHRAYNYTNQGETAWQKATNRQEPMDIELVATTDMVCALQRQWLSEACAREFCEVNHVQKGLYAELNSECNSILAHVIDNCDGSILMQRVTEDGRALPRERWKDTQMIVKAAPKKLVTILRLRGIA
jgi:hypothetical protein